MNRHVRGRSRGDDDCRRIERERGRLVDGDARIERPAAERLRQHDADLSFAVRDTGDFDRRGVRCRRRRHRRRRGEDRRIG